MTTLFGDLESDLVWAGDLPKTAVWSGIVPYLRLELPGPVAPQRIEVTMPSAGTSAYVQLVTLRVRCARCGAPIHPIRERQGWGRWCVSVTWNWRRTSAVRGRARRGAR